MAPFSNTSQSLDKTENSINIHHLLRSFQARIGAMDGVFIAYHNTARMFGFQYVPVAEMEQRLYGPGPPERGERVFEKCVGLMEVLVAQIVDCFPGQVS